MKKLSILLVLLLLCLSVPVTGATGYDLLYPFSGGVARVVKEEKWGLIDRDLKTVLPLTWDYVGELQENRRVVMQNLLFGFLDETGKTVIAPQYMQVGKFSEGLCCVKNQEGMWGYIDNKGNTVLPFNYEDANNFSAGLALVKKEGLWYYIEADGVELTLEKFEEAYPFSEGLACVRQEGLYGYLDADGDFAIPPAFDLAFDFCEGAAVVQSCGQYGLIDSAGTYLIRPKFESMSAGAKAGYLKAQQGGKWGVIDTMGVSHSAFEYDWIGDFSEGLCPVRIDGNYGYLNRDFQLEIPAEWDGVGPFSEGLAPVSRDGAWGYIDKKGQLACALVYAECGSISQGYALVCDEAGLWQYIKPEDLKASEEITDEGEENLLETETLEERTLGLQIGRFTMTQNGIEIPLEAAPVINQDFTFMPIRAVVEAIGGVVVWEAEEQKIQVTCGGHSIVLRIGERGAVVDGRMTLLDIAPMIQNERTLVPLRFVMEHLGCQLTWEPETREIIIAY